MSDAEFYQKHKDDLDEWGEAEGSRGRKPPRDRLNAIISVRLTPEEEDALKQAASDRGLTLSAFVRAAALHEAAPATVSHWAYHSSHTEASMTPPTLSVLEHVVTGTGLEVALQRDLVDS